MYDEDLKYGHDSSSDSSMPNSLRNRGQVSGSNLYDEPRKDSLDSREDVSHPVIRDDHMYSSYTNETKMRKLDARIYTQSSKVDIKVQSKDLVEELAEQKKLEKVQERNRRVRYQVSIFAIAYALNFFNNLRQQYIYEVIGCFSDRCHISSVTKIDTACDSFRYSITISAGIGFIFLGNIYDNIDSPRRVTTALLCILSLIALVEAVFSGPSFFKPSDITTKQVVMTLYQMSSVFEAGISLACIVIIHNWFKETILGSVCALWLTAIYMQKIVQIAIYQSQPCHDTTFEKTLEIESYVLSGCYLLLAIFCWFFFYHHPSHIGIQIHSK